MHSPFEQYDLPPDWTPGRVENGLFEFVHSERSLAVQIRKVELGSQVAEDPGQHVWVMSCDFGGTATPSSKFVCSLTTWQAAAAALVACMEQLDAALERAEDGPSDIDAVLRDLTVRDSLGRKFDRA
ncbi:hypothetical protein [Halomarina pelagica]|uniref:hypothetical protein n=1 Tax=Halomarina pelagica TaxID=2961599 RepID=UPI0020C3CEB3|nr:hypothetical protein [Halomarina sp. BND7]